MQLKDYYKILEVAPLASQQEIKKSFRRLALKFHPDKNEGNHLAEAQFREIQEAYEILSDPVLRKEYNYKRWHLRSLGKNFEQASLTPTAILEECRAIKTYVDSMSIFRLNYDAVSQHIRQIVTPNAIGILHQFNDKPTNNEIVLTLLKAANALPFRYFMPIISILLQIRDTDSGVQTTVDRYVREKKLHETWDKYKWVVVLLITTLIIWLMVEFGN
jgi:molecular chaperone DnaJ